MSWNFQPSYEMQGAQTVEEETPAEKASGMHAQTC